MKKLAFYINIIEKLADKTLYLYTFVPVKALDSIKKKGLLSAIKLINDPEALHLARPKDADKFKNTVKEHLKNPEWKDLTGSISAFFTLPDWSLLPKNHNIFKLELVPIKINLSKLIKDFPDTKLLGVELEKYDPELDKQPNRERNLSLKEIKSFTDELPSQLWKHYDSSKSKMYAPDVPHLMILTKSKKIPAKYLVI